VVLLAPLSVFVTVPSPVPEADSSAIARRFLIGLEESGFGLILEHRPNYGEEF
jgi:hypothetical protein